MVSTYEPKNSQNPHLITLSPSASLRFAGSNTGYETFSLFAAILTSRNQIIDTNFISSHSICGLEVVFHSNYLPGLLKPVPLVSLAPRLLFILIR